MMDGEIRAKDPAESEQIDPEMEVTVDTRMVTERVHFIMQAAHEALDHVEAEMLERIIRSIRVRRKAERSYLLTLDHGK